MAVTNQTFSQTNAGTGGYGPYPVSFRFDTTQPHEVILLIESPSGDVSAPVYGTDYYLIGQNLYTIAAYSSAYTLHIKRSTTRVQSVDLMNGQRIAPSDLEERGLDRLVMQVQEIDDLTSKSLRGDSAIDEISGFSDRAGKYLVFDSDGEPTVGVGPSVFLSGDNLWSVGSTYELDDIVNYGGTLWVSLENDNTGNTPAEDAHWTEYGQGPAGATGAQGPQGEQGEAGPAGADGEVLMEWTSSEPDEVDMVEGVLYLVYE